MVKGRGNQYKLARKWRVKLMMFYASLDFSFLFSGQISFWSPYIFPSSTINIIRAEIRSTVSQKNMYFPQFFLKCRENLTSDTLFTHFVRNIEH